MIQPELWMLTPFVLFVSLKIPLINADDKSQRKPSDQNENYIITHYGKEYYTPVSDIESVAQHGQSGYYTAEVIPVDARTGEELKPVKNLFVPMHTGYSIGVADNLYVDHVDTDLGIEPPTKNNERSTTELGQGEFFAKDDAAVVKSKTPKKFFKSKYAMAAKKNVVPYYNSDEATASSSNTAAVVTLEDNITNQHHQRSKKNQKRNAFHNRADDDEFLRMFYDNFKIVMQQHYLGYY